VRGDSMYPLLKAGDIVCYKTISDLKNILWGEMYILDIDSGYDQFITIKYVQKLGLGDEYIKLVFRNQHYQPKDEPIKNIRALAMVKLSIRYNTIS
jgi:phage repressor protein C with HTH and peptisase S24 domain